jgi:hypothetical protein
MLNQIKKLETFFQKKTLEMKIEIEPLDDKSIASYF